MNGCFVFIKIWQSKTWSTWIFFHTGTGRNFANITGALRHQAYGQFTFLSILLLINCNLKMKTLQSPSYNSPSYSGFSWDWVRLAFSSHGCYQTRESVYIFYVEEDKVNFSHTLSLCRAVLPPGVLTISDKVSLFCLGAHLIDPNPAHDWGAEDAWELLRLAPCCQSQLPMATVEDSREGLCYHPEERWRQDGQSTVPWHPHLKPDRRAGEDRCSAADLLPVFVRGLCPCCFFRFVCIFYELCAWSVTLKYSSIDAFEWPPALREIRCSPRFCLRKPL